MDPDKVQVRRGSRTYKLVLMVGGFVVPLLTNLTYGTGQHFLSSVYETWRRMGFPVSYKATKIEAEMKVMKPQLLLEEEKH